MKTHTSTSPNYIEHSFLSPVFAAPAMDRISRLTEADRDEALSFLEVRPVQTIVMSSFIIDNGVESDLNRGEFYAYRDAEGRIEGMALIGHTTLVEARSSAAMAALAITASRTEAKINLIMSGGHDAQKFWTLMKGNLEQPRLVCTEALFEASFPFVVQNCEWNIREAEMDQLIQVAEAQAEIAFVECGNDPMVRDRDGFLSRVARRIEQKRVFTVFEDGKLLFKADIISQTPDAIYLEGIYVHPEYRGKGMGSRCLAALTSRLLSQASHICLLSNVDFDTAHRSYERAGYKRTGECVTLFV